MALAHAAHMASKASNYVWSAATSSQSSLGGFGWDDEPDIMAELEPLHPPDPPPTRVVVRSPLHGTHTINGLEEGATVAWLKAQLQERITLKPGRQIHLSLWGLDLADEATLQECRIKTGCKLDMRTSLAPISGRGLAERDETQELENLHRIFERLDGKFDGKKSEDKKIDQQELSECLHSLGHRVHGERLSQLTRVRVVSTAIKTRLFAVDTTTTAADLKKKIMDAITRGEHEWHGKDGEVISVCGATVLCSANVNGDEKLGTAKLSQGEELILNGLFHEPSKKVVSMYRAATGQSILANDTPLVGLRLPPEQQRLSWMGADLPDHKTLWEVGVPNDGDIALQFSSPVMPAILQFMRAPEKPGKAKGGGKKGKKGK